MDESEFDVLQSRAVLESDAESLADCLAPAIEGFNVQRTPRERAMGRSVRTVGLCRYGLPSSVVFSDDGDADAKQVLGCIGFEELLYERAAASCGEPAKGSGNQGALEEGQMALHVRLPTEHQILDCDGWR